MKIAVLTFARIREIVGAGTLERELPGDATAGDAWAALARDFPALADLRASTRMARGGSLVDAGTPLREGDELALLPPFGGG